MIVTEKSLFLIMNQAYQTLLEQGKIEKDRFQIRALEILDHMANETLLCPPTFWQKVLGKKETGLGVYLWGGVGRGKTWVMDLFFQHLPIQKKRRVHFHAFMQEIQEKLAAHNHEKNPMQKVVQLLDIKILCLDEFIVDDIGDAMVLASLLDALFSQKIVLVVTSNIPPNKLYQYGLQRQRFLPAIAAIETHMEVFFLNHESDYRIQTTAAEVTTLASYFEYKSGEKTVSAIALRHHKLDFLHAAPPALWLSFSQLCDVPLGRQEYLLLAQQYQVLLLEAVYPMTEWHNDKAKRFVTLVDVFYDKKQWIILDAEVDIDGLYTGTQLAFEFKRIKSRLHEMRRTINENT